MKRTIKTVFSGVQSVIFGIFVLTYTLNAAPFQDKHGIKNTDSFILKVQLGLIPNAFIVHQFGQNLDVGTTVETLTTISTLYPYALGYNSQAKTIQLTSSGNDHITVQLNGLDALGNLQSEIVTINDGMPVSSTKTYSRLFNAHSTSSTNLLGTVSLTVNGTIISTLTPTNQTTSNAIYTIPKGYTGHLMGGTVSSGKSKDITFIFAVRYYQKTFITVDSVYTFESTLDTPRPYQAIPELSDVEIRVLSSQTGSTASGSFTLLVIKNNTFD